MDIKELALKVSKEMIWRMDEMTLETFAARLISAYLAEPVAWRTHHDEPMLFPTINEAWQYCEDDEGPEPLFAAPVKDSLTTEPEPSEFSAEQRDKDWSAIKSTAPSSEEVGQLHPDMARSAAKSALGYAGSFNDKGIDWHNDKPWPHRMELAQALDWITELGAMVLNLASRVTPTAPSSEEVREILVRLNAVGNTSLEYAVADLIELLAAERDMWRETDLRDAARVDELAAEVKRLAALVPAITHDEWYAAQNRISELLIFVKKISEQIPEKPDYWNSCSQCEHNASEAEDLLIAAGEVKP